MYKINVFTFHQPVRYLLLLKLYYNLQNLLAYAMGTAIFLKATQVSVAREVLAAL